MKRYFKKVLSMLIAFAIIIGMKVTPLVQADAATGDITYHFKLPAGWSASTTFYHSWSSLDLTGGTTIQAWGANKTTLVDEGDGWASIKITNGVNETGFSLVNWNVDTASATNELKMFNSGIKYANVTDAYCNITSTEGDGTGLWYKEKSMTNEINALIPTNDFYVTGSKELTGINWGDGFGDGNYGLKMTSTATTGVFETKAHNVAAGSYEFKIVQDPEHFSWNLAIGSTSGNFGFTLTESKDVTIRLNLNEEGDDRIEIFTANPQVLAEDVIAAINDIGTVTLDSKEKIEAAESLYAAASEEEQKKVTNYETLTEARKAYDALSATKKTGYDVVIHFKNSENWDPVCAFQFYKDFGYTCEWPKGDIIKPDTKNAGWYTMGFNTEVKDGVCIMFHNIKKLTQSIELELNDGKGEFWITLTQGDKDELGQVILVPVATKTAPEGWIPSEVQETEPINIGIDPIEDPKPIETTTESKKEDNKTTQATIADTAKSTPVKTGDTAPIALTTLFAISATMVVVAKKKKKVS